MYLVYYSPFVIMLNSQTGHVNDTHVMSLKKPCLRQSELSETPASEDVVTARETRDEDVTKLELEEEATLRSFSDPRP